MRSLGLMLLLTGGVIAAAGLALVLAPRVPWLGHLPGDIHYRGKHTEFHFPLVSCLLVSVVLTVLLNLLLRLFRR